MLGKVEGELETRPFGIVHVAQHIVGRAEQAVPMANQDVVVGFVVHAGRIDG